MYFVVEVCDRELAAMHPAEDLAAAVAVANGLLEEHCATIGVPELYSVAKGLERQEGWPPDASPADVQDGNLDAWCNAKGFKWDAHITSMDQGKLSMTRDILLKELCKSVMDADGSRCGDGGCDECPVNAVLEMAGSDGEEEDGDGECE